MLLYHYAKLETALLHIIPTMKLRFGKMHETNDPKENKLFFHNLIHNGSMLENKNIECFMDETAKLVFKNSKLICFTYQGATDEIKGYENSYMWNFYGSKHKGVCLCFDADRLIKTNEKFIHDKELVEYVEPKHIKAIHKHDIELDYRGEKDSFILEQLRNKYRKEIYFKKLKYWQAENEYRLVNYSKECENVYLDISDSLCHIFFGIDLDDISVKSYIKYISQHVDDKKIFKLFYQNGRYNCKPSSDLII